MSISPGADEESKLPGDNRPSENQSASDSSIQLEKKVEKQEPTDRKSTNYLSRTQLQISKGPKRKSASIKPYILTPNDTNDPSYTNLQLPYSVLCRQRYHQAGINQRKQFTKEIKAHELLRPRALDGVRLHREFCNPVIEKISRQEKITLTRKQKEKLEQLLQEP